MGKNVDTVKFIIPGAPFGKQRPKFANKSAYTPKETVNYENLVKLVYQQESKGYIFPADVMLSVKIVAYYPIPKSTSKRNRELMMQDKLRPTKKPDWDNIGNVVCDSLNKIAYYDDKNIVDAAVRKFYSENPRVEVAISRI